MKRKLYFIPNLFFKIFFAVLLFGLIIVPAVFGQPTTQDTGFDISTLLSQEFLAKAFAVYTVIVTIANMITMLLPSVTTNPVYNIVMKILNFLSLNILKNKNADAVIKQ